MVSESDNVGPPVIYQTEDAGMVGVLLDCGHHAVISKMAPVWSDPMFALLCDECVGDHWLHPLVLLETDYWEESAQ